MEAINEFLNSPFFAGFFFIALFIGSLAVMVFLLEGGDDKK